MPLPRLAERPQMIERPETEESLRSELVTLHHQWQMLKTQNTPRRPTVFGKMVGLEDIEKQMKEIEDREKEIRLKLKAYTLHPEVLRREK